MDDRELGPEMIAEGWMVVSGDGLMWPHPPSRRCVHLIETYDGTGDFVVACAMHGEQGYPVGVGDEYRVASYSEALRRARAIRRSILAERRDVSFADQGALFE